VTGKVQGTQRKIGPGAALPTTNFTCGDLGSKPGFGGEIRVFDGPRYFRLYND